MSLPLPLFVLLVLAFALGLRHGQLFARARRATRRAAVVPDKPFGDIVGKNYFLVPDDDCESCGQRTFAGWTLCHDQCNLCMRCDQANKRTIALRIIEEFRQAAIRDEAA